MKNENGQPNWAKMGFYENYKDVDRLIINKQRKIFIKYGWKE